MRKFSKRDKDILNEIIRQNGYNISAVKLFKEGFKDSGFALFFSFSLKQVFLLRKDSKAYDLGLSITTVH